MLLSAILPAVEFIPILKFAEKSEVIISDEGCDGISEERQQKWKDSGLTVKQSPHQHTKTIFFVEKINGKIVLTIIVGSYNFTAGPGGFTGKDSEEQFENVTVIRKVCSPEEFVEIKGRFDLFKQTILAEHVAF